MKARPKQKSLRELNLQVNLFNDGAITGTPVSVRRDNGEVLSTKTRSIAWVMGEHSAVIMVDGISGAISLDRVTKL